MTWNRGDIPCGKSCEHVGNCAQSNGQQKAYNPSHHHWINVKHASLHRQKVTQKSGKFNQNSNWGMNPGFHPADVRLAEVVEDC